MNYMQLKVEIYSHCALLAHSHRQFPLFSLLFGEVMRPLRFPMSARLGIRRSEHIVTTEDGRQSSSITPCCSWLQWSVWLATHLACSTADSASLALSNEVESHLEVCPYLINPLFDLVWREGLVHLFDAEATCICPCFPFQVGQLALKCLHVFVVWTPSPQDEIRGDLYRREIVSINATATGHAERLASLDKVG